MLARGIFLLAVAVYSSKGGAVRFNDVLSPQNTQEDVCTDPPLQIAIIRNETEKVKDLLFYGEDMYEENCEGLNSLQVALLVDNECLVSELVNSKFDIGSRNRFGDTVLHTAVYFRRSNALRLFIEKSPNLDVDVVNNGNETPFLLSILLKNNEAFDILIDNGANVNLRLPGGNTYIHQATKIAAARVLILFAAFNVSIDAVNDDDETALHVATQMDKPAMINVILSQGADYRRKNRNGETYIHTAVKHGSINALRTLLRHRGFIDEENGKGETPLKLAVEMNRADLVNCLIDSGANVRKVFTKGKSYTHIAAQSNSNDALRVLLERGIPPDVKDSDGFTASYDAILSDNVQALGILKQFGAKLSIHFSNWEWGDLNYLQEAAILGKVESIKWLVANGISVNATSNRAMPPNALHLAAEYGRYESVLTLLDLGVCVNCITDWPLTLQFATAYDIAWQSEQNDICDLLRSRGGLSKNEIKPES